MSQTRPLRGRGATCRPAPRFDREVHEPFDDGWGSLEEDLARDRIPTHVELERSRTVISKNDSPDLPFERSLNPYRGCEHGCVYCFARPTHAYLGYSPGIDFETRIVAKPEAPEAFARELQQQSYRPQVLALGANTDPYQPIEKKLEITRALLAICNEYRHPVLVITKSQMILRDLDLLAPMAEQGLCSVRISLTTLDPKLARIMEPRAPTPARRLRAMETLARAGVPVGALTSPMIPAINDSELEQLLHAAADAGACGGCYALLRLPHELVQIFSKWLEVHFPARKKRVLSLLADCHAGRVYRSDFTTRMRGSGPYAELLAARFQRACERLGLAQEPPPLRCDAFLRPAPATDNQLSLF